MHIAIVLKGGKKMKTYTIEEVAKILKLSTESIRRYLKSGTLKGSRLGRQWRISEEDLNKFFENNSNKKNTKE